ncbi:MAG: ATP-binding protein [Thermoleophilia bacterium]
MTATSDNFAISLDRETFLRTMVGDIAYLLESSLGAACAGDYVGRVGLSMGAWIEHTYRDACNLKEALTPQQYAGIIVDLKQHTGGDFSIVEVTPEAVTVVSRTCPFGEAVARTPGLCRMTASVFGGIAARNFSFARVNIVHSLARGDSGCEVTIYLKPTPAALAAGGDTYTREMADVSPRIEEAAPAIRQKMQDGEVVAGIEVVRDITEQLNAQKELIEKSRRLERLAAVAIENANLLDETRQQLDVQRELTGAATSISRELERRVHERTEALVRMYEESERKSRELEQANMKLREVDLLKSEFLANMSHELRTPLNSIIGFSKLILDGLDGEINPEQEHDLGIVYVNAGELLRMIDDLLGLAKIEAGRVSLELQPADPADIAREVVMSFRSTAAEKGLELKLELPPEMEAVVTDRGKIRQVLMNLVGNAFKFTEAGGVRLAIEQTSDTTVFVVSDTGAGLTPDQMEAVFDRFYQVAPSPAEVGGVGLGLAISKRFVEMHGGRIWVESSPGKGSTFSFFIPSQGPAAMASNQTG